MVAQERRQALRRLSRLGSYCLPNELHIILLLAVDKYLQIQPRCTVQHGVNRKARREPSGQSQRQRFMRGVVWLLDSRHTHCFEHEGHRPLKFVRRTTAASMAHASTGTGIRRVSISAQDLQSRVNSALFNELVSCPSNRDLRGRPIPLLAPGLEGRLRRGRGGWRSHGGRRGGGCAQGGCSSRERAACTAWLLSRVSRVRCAVNFRGSILGFGFL
jgi:hypothetical protein